MKQSQRTALIGMMDAILACDCADTEMRLRAQTLRIRLRLESALGCIFG